MNDNLGSFQTLTDDLIQQQSHLKDAVNYAIHQETDMFIVSKEKEFLPCQKSLLSLFSPHIAYLLSEVPCCASPTIFLPDFLAHHIRSLLHILQSGQTLPSGDFNVEVIHTLANVLKIQINTISIGHYLNNPLNIKEEKIEQIHSIEEQKSSIIKEEVIKDEANLKIPIQENNQVQEVQVKRENNGEYVEEEIDKIFKQENNEDLDIDKVLDDTVSLQNFMDKNKKSEDSIRGGKYSNKIDDAIKEEIYTKSPRRKNFTAKNDNQRVQEFTENKYIKEEIYSKSPRRKNFTAKKDDQRVQEFTENKYIKEEIYSKSPRQKNFITKKDYQRGQNKDQRAQNKLRKKYIKEGIYSKSPRRKNFTTKKHDQRVQEFTENKVRLRPISYLVSNEHEENRYEDEISPRAKRRKISPTLSHGRGKSKSLVDEQIDVHVHQVQQSSPATFTQNKRSSYEIPSLISFNPKLLTYPQDESWGQKKSDQTSMTPYQQSAVDASNSNMTVKCPTVSPTFIQTSTPSPTPCASPPMMHNCAQCGTEFFDSKSLTKHTRNHHEIYTCTKPGCDQKTVGYYQMALHCKAAHKKTFLACKCGLIFTEKKILMNHQNNCFVMN